MSDTKTHVAKQVSPTRKRDAVTFVNEDETEIRSSSYMIIIKGTDIFGKFHTLIISETYGYRGNKNINLSNSVWIGPIQVILGLPILYGVRRDLRFIRETKSLFFCIQNPVDIRSLCQHCEKYDGFNEYVEWNPCNIIFRNFKKFLGKQESAIVTRVSCSKLLNNLEFEKYVLHSVFDHDVQGKIHGLKTQYECNHENTRQTNCKFYCHGKRVNKAQWKQYKQNLIARVIGVTSIAKVVTSTIILQYLFNVPSIFPQQLKVKLDYELSVPIVTHGIKADSFGIEQLDFKFMRPFARNYYTCHRSRFSEGIIRRGCKCNKCKMNL